MAGFVEKKGELPQGAYFSGKKMLVISLQEIQGDHVLRIEMESHYGYPRCLVIKHYEIPEVEIEEILGNFELCKNIGYWTYLENLPGRYDYPAVILSIKDFNDHKKLRLDVKNYFDDDNRKFIKNIPLPSNDKLINRKNDRLLQAIGRTVLETLLPLEEQWPTPEK